MTSTGGGRHCAPERRVPRVQPDESTGFTWVTLCGCYSDDCVQLTIRLEDEHVGVRKSNDPGHVVWFDGGEFAEFLDAVRDPARDIMAEALGTSEQFRA